MLEIKLERAYEPEVMEPRPCAICGTDFKPKAVTAYLADTAELVCESCLSHLAVRATQESVPANWDEVYRRYLEAVPKYPEPIFPSVEALMEAERRDVDGTHAYLQETAEI